MASTKRVVAFLAMATVAFASPARNAHLKKRATMSETLTTAGYTPYYAALATHYTTDPASAATSTTTAHQPCVTQPEAGTYCGFINPEDPCSPQPGGYGPVPPQDNPSAFLAFPTLHSMAQAAPTTVPSTTNSSQQYVQVFKDLNASISGGDYLGLYDLETYDVPGCAALCDQQKSCISFNMFAERDPSLLPSNNDSTAPTVWGYNCPNPASMTVFKCTLWGNVISAGEANNYGSYQEQFHIVITGSDGYTLENVPVSSSSTSCTSTPAASPTPTSSSTTPTTSSIASTSTPSSTVVSTSTTSSSSSTVVSTSTTSSSSTSPAPTCAACSSGSFTDDNGKAYNVHCGWDYVGDDLGPVEASCYEDCFDLCDQNPQCNAFTFNPTAQGGAHCWIKNLPPGVTGGPSDCTGVVFGQLPPPPPPPACPACTGGSVTDPNGKEYNINCGWDHVGNDLGPVAASCWQDCYDICDNDSQCNAFTFNPTADGGAHCWPKNIPSGQTGGPSDCPGVIFGQMPPPAPVCATCTGGSVTDDKGQSYDVTCGSDHWGNDLGPVAATCAEDCYDLCDANSQCNAFTFNPVANGGPHCWLKNVPTGTVPQPINVPGIVYAAQPPPPPTPTPSTCTAPSTGPFSCLGDVWHVSCGMDHWGDDCSQAPATCYDDCFQQCQDNWECTAFTFDSESSLCWLKNPSVCPSLNNLHPMQPASSCTFVQKISPNSAWSFDFPALPGWGSGGWR